jgi:beta-hydroxylase
MLEALKWILLIGFLASVIYVHWRGRVRHRFGRQLLDHSTFMAPINVLMYFGSRVPTTPFIPQLERFFPELEPLRAHWREIRDEGLRLREMAQIKAANGNDAGFNTFFRRGWKRFYLKWYDTAHPSAGRLCPITTGLLKDIPSVKAAMFAELPAGSRLGNHRDPFAGSLRLHLGLQTPNDDACYINVDGESYSWRDGEWTMFDETYIHHAKNETAHHRLILFCDVERPMKYRWARRFNRFVARHLLAAAASPNMEGDKTGGVNRVFRYIHILQVRGKALRNRSKSANYAYYVLKYLLVAALILLLIWL